MPTPDALAIIWNDRSFSWAQCDEYVHSTSRRLKEIGVKAGSRILVEAVPTPGTIVVLFSLWHIGAVACPVDPRLTDAMAGDILRKIRPSLLLFSTYPKEKFHGLRRFTIDDVICLEPVERFISGASPESSLPLDRDALILFTSGSSGEPKAVLHSYAALLSNAQGAAERIPFTTGDRWLLTLPLYRISGISVLFRALLGKAAVVLPGKNSTNLPQAVVQGKPTHISIVPTQFLRLFESLPSEGWRPLQAILIGGAPIPDSLIQKAVAQKLPVFLTYGMTETGSQIATSSIDEARQSGARVLKFREISIINGEICVKGDVLFKGYVDGDQLIRPLDALGWFHTGDAGSYEPPFVKVTGRLDRMFISGGENIYPEVIERALLGLEGVLSARVEPKEDTHFGRVPKAFLKLQQGAAFDQEKGKRLLGAQLLPFQIPKEYVIVEDFDFKEKQ